MRKATKILRTGTLVIIASIIGIVSGEVWRIGHHVTTTEELMGWNQSGADETLSPIISFNGVTEGKIDRNDDTIPDSWFVEIRKSEPLGLGYFLFDSNFDGEPNVLNVYIANERTVYSIRDGDDDGVADNQTFRLSNLTGAENQPSYFYFDINLDGKLDMMVLLEPVEGGKPKIVDNYILLDDAWVGIINEAGGDWTKGFYLRDHDSGEDVSVVFVIEDGIWMRTRDITSVEPGERVPDFHLLTIEGDDLDLQALEDKVVVLYFFDRFYTPCVVELSVLDEAKRERWGSAVDFMIVGIGIDCTVEDLRKIQEKYSLSFPLVSDPDRAALHTFSSNRVSRYVLIDRTGRVLRNAVTYLKYEMSDGVYIGDSIDAAVGERN